MREETSSSGVFSDAKVVESRALNRAGIQPLRAVLARLLYRLGPALSDPMAAELRRTGLVVWEEFLPADAFAAVQDEVGVYTQDNAPSLEYEWGTTELEHYYLNGVDRDWFPHLAKWQGDQRDVAALAASAERRQCRPTDGGGLIELLRFGDYSVVDTQTELHIDTFHNTHRVWLYLDDVNEENAPFVYVPGSHHLDRVRLRADYVESTGRNLPSRRVSDDEVRSRRLERRVITCPANTLVVANTSGYHCRSKGEAGASRRALHMTFRSLKPFALQPVASALKQSARRRVRSMTSR